jgi:hypothetical protein
MEHREYRRKEVDCVCVCLCLCLYIGVFVWNREVSKKQKKNVA